MIGRLFTVLVALPLISAASTYYAAPTGSDSNAGSLAAPFATLQHFANLANPGDTLIVEDGTYTGSTCSGGSGCTLLNITRSGTSGNYITFQAQHTGGAILDGQSQGTDEGINVDGSWIKIQGFEIRNFFSQGIVLGYHSGSNFWVLQNNIHGISRFCPTTTGPLGGNPIYIQGSNAIIERNQLHNSGRFNTGESGCTDPAGYNNWFNHGIYVAGYSGSQTGLTIRNNLIWNNKAGYGIQLYGGAISNSSIINNTLAFGSAFHPGLMVFAETITGVTVENNIMLQPGTEAIHDGGSGYGSTVIKNNLTDSSTLLSSGAPSGTTISGNLLGTNALVVSTGIPDFHLQSTSPAIDAGLTIFGETNDYAGTARPQGFGYDIGAYEFLGSAPPPTPPAITSFTATPSGAVTPGTPVTLAWTSTGGTSATLNGSPVALSGTQTVSPLTTTGYTLVVSNSAGPATQTVTVSVGPLPVISSFAATPSTIALGGSSTLALASTGGTSCSIDQGVGSVTCNSSTPVTPLTSKLYTATVTNSFGSVTAQALVGVSISALVGASVVNGQVVIH